jgi:hypothetical protein
MMRFFSMLKIGLPNDTTRTEVKKYLPARKWRSWPKLTLDYYMLDYFTFSFALLCSELKNETT